MKTLCAFLLLCVVACHLPVKEDPCNLITGPGCGDQEQPTLKRYAGLSARYTVQNMLHFTLINGRPAEPAEWPASVYVKAGDAACSATLVGDRTVFIASHCVSDEGQIEFSAHANSYTARCDMHPEYARNKTADWALCLTDRPVTGIPFEVLGSVPPKLGDAVLLSGYGCVQKGGGGGNDGIFRVGAAVVEGLPKGKTYDFVLKGGSALCFGDSGGAGYVIRADGSRYIFGVNSRGDIDTMSYIPDVSQKSFTDWAKKWARESNNVKICGIHSDATSCRTGGAKPKADGNYQISSEVGCVKGYIQPQYLGRKSEIVEKVTKALQP